MNIPSIASIENLKTPSFEELVKSSSFLGAKLSKQENGEVKNLSEALSPREHRLPFAAINWIMCSIDVAVEIVQLVSENDKISVVWNFPR